MHAIVGLGNPGSPYAATRHNVGFVVVAQLARRWRLAWGQARHGSRIAVGSLDGKPLLLVEPQMYMNLTGLALSYVDPPVSAAGLIVIHDDIDLSSGRLRIRHGGGSGGHRGVESIVSCYGPDFTRVRVGVGRPSDGQDAAAYVLSPFADAERECIAAAVQSAADAVECILRDGLEVAMNRFNTRSKGAPSVAAVPMGRN